MLEEHARLLRAVISLVKQGYGLQVVSDLVGLMLDQYGATVDERAIFHQELVDAFEEWELLNANTSDGHSGSNNAPP